MWKQKWVMVVMHGIRHGAKRSTRISERASSSENLVSVSFFQVNWGKFQFQWENAARDLISLLCPCSCRYNLAWTIYVLVFVVHVLPAYTGVIQDLLPDYFPLVVVLYVTLGLMLLLQFILVFIRDPGILAILEDGHLSSTPEMDRFCRDQCELYGVDPAPPIKKAIRDEKILKDLGPYPLRADLLRLSTDFSETRNSYSLYLARFDHWCPWVNQPIAFKNHRLFFMFTTAAFVHLLTACICIFVHPLFGPMTKHAMKRFPYGPFIVTPKLAVFTLCTCVAAVAIVIVAGLVQDQLLGISTDVTVVEYSSNKKYAFNHYRKEHSWKSYFRNWYLFLIQDSYIETLDCTGSCRRTGSAFLASKKKHWNEVAKETAEQIERKQSSAI